MFTAANIKKRLERVYALERRDPDKFKPNPLGPGYLTRRERYSEVIWELKRRLEKLGRAA